MIQPVLSNLAIILLMHLFMSLVINFRNELSDRVFRFSVIFLVSAAVIAMFFVPISFGEYDLDMRFIPLVFLAYLWGWKYALPVLIIVCTFRFLLGGAGMVPGILFGMVGPTLLALAFHHRAKLQGKYIEKILFIIACWFISDFPMIFLLPNGLAIFKEVALLRVTTFVATAIILYIFIIHERQRRTLHERLQRLAGEDPLTKLLNKRRFYEILEDKLKQNRQHEHFIAMLDLDHFKKLNDTYGHIIGDEVLIMVGKILKNHESNHVKIGRYGGEEFILYIGNETFENAERALEQIRSDIEEACLILEKGKRIRVTVSIGYASIEKNAPVLKSVNQADKNLYLAKMSGRNQVISPQKAAQLKTS